MLKMTMQIASMKKMRPPMHLSVFVTIYASNVINVVQNSLFEHSLVYICSSINALMQYLHKGIMKCACMLMQMHYTTSWDELRSISG